VYVGMIAGEIPGLALDRTGVALLGAIAVVAVRGLPVEHAWSGVDVPTLLLLFAMMVVSAQFRLAGFYSGWPRARSWRWSTGSCWCCSSDCSS
jgi:Na+/H+ antiporter NhaD/arsenite permease-like protein